MSAFTVSHACFANEGMAAQGRLRYFADRPRIGAFCQIVIQFATFATESFVSYVFNQNMAAEVLDLG